MGPQRKAAIWHEIDFAATTVLFIISLVGLVGHFKLRKQYQEELINRRIDKEIHRYE